MGHCPTKILPDGIFNWWSGTPGGSRFGGDWWERWSTDHFLLPLLLNGFQQVGPYFPHAALKRANLRRLIASGRAALQLPEDVAAAPFGIGNQPGQDLLPLPFKRVFVGAPPAQHAFSSLLLSVQALEPCCRIRDILLLRKRTHGTIVHGKDADRGSSEE